MKFGDPTKVINREAHPIEWMYAGRRYVLEPGVEAMVPWEVAVMYLGNPEISEKVTSTRDPDTDEVIWLPGRQDEIRRLRTLYDNHVCVPGMCNHYPGAQMGDDSKVGNTPAIEVYDYKGNRIKMIVDDPTGDDFRPATQTVTEVQALRAMVARQEKDMELLKRQVEELLPTGEPEGTYLSHAPGSQDNPVDLTGSLATGRVPTKVLLDTDTNLVSTGEDSSDDLPRDV